GGVAQRPAADAPNERPMPLDEGRERRLVAPLGEVLQQLQVGAPGGLGPGEEATDVANGAQHRASAGTAGGGTLSGGLSPTASRRVQMLLRIPKDLLACACAENPARTSAARSSLSLTVSHCP